MAGGRPTEYTPELIEKAKSYLTTCIDVNEDKENGISKQVNIPSKAGLALALGVSRETLYDWASKYEEFSDIMEQMGAKQEIALINNGLSGKYNQTITKVLLTKHGYREGIDQTTNDKELPTPIMNVQRDDSNQ